MPGPYGVNVNVSYDGPDTLEYCDMESRSNSLTLYQYRSIYIEPKTRVQSRRDLSWAVALDSLDRWRQGI
jgi:hypothetical protein